MILVTMVRRVSLINMGDAAGLIFFLYSHPYATDNINRKNTSVIGVIMRIS